MQQLGFTEQHARTCGLAAAVAAISAHADKLARLERRQVVRP